MKIIHALTIFILSTTLSTIRAQNNTQVLKTKTTKTFNFEKDGTTIPYRVTVYKTSKSKVILDQKDKTKLNQKSTNSLEEVTKLIYVDNDRYPDYDKYIVLRYVKDPNDSFELKPTQRGFKVVVDQKNVEYIFGEGMYFVNNEDKDFFYIDEFNSI